MTTYALIGDSQGAGLEAPLRALVPIVFADPKVGWTTARIRSGGPFAGALASSADAILLVTGGNDDPLNATSLLDMVELARAAGKGLVVVGPVFAVTDDGPRHDRARAALQSTLRGKAARFVDAYPMTRDLARPENVHLTASGYQRYASRLAAGLRSGGVSALALAIAFAGAYAIARALRA